MEQYIVDRFYTKTQEPYQFLLTRREWKAKREAILARDKHRCTMCGKEESQEEPLHVHHTQYFVGLDPWEYDNNDLVTLCEHCHSMVHLEGIHIYRIDEGTPKLLFVEPCLRCGGTGYFAEYRHIQNGICFRCHGARYEEFINVYEKYARDHEMEISNLDDGFVPMSNKEKSEIKEAIVEQSPFDPEKLYVKIVKHDNYWHKAFLDFSVKANPGDRLLIGTLRLKEYFNKKTNKPFIVMTGKVIKEE